MKHRYLMGVTLALAGLAAQAADGVKVENITFDVRGAKPPDYRAPYISQWQGTSPAGVHFSADKTVILKNGQPFAVASGEFHPQRYPAEYWEEEIMKMKAGGLNVIASYWFWSLFEPEKGQFNFSGQNDIRRFTALCQKHGLLVFARIGPFCNAEFLHGGLPPWMFGMPYTARSNDPGYLKRVEIYYNELGQQLKGMMWGEGGPIYMVQVENELGRASVDWDTTYRHGVGEDFKGPEDPKDYWQHYLNLKALAIKAGFHVPFYSITAWGPADFRTKYYQADNSLLFTYGGYMYLGQPPKGKNSGLTTITPDARILKTGSPYPLAFIELGAAGSPHRTGYVGLPPAESAESTGICQIGAHDSIMCGWYMYQGGTNPRIPFWGPSAKRDEFGISYDYHAPLSEYGYERPAYYLLRRFHQTLLNYADRFCYGKIVTQEPRVKANDDLLRSSVRMGDGDGGMLFISHYGNQVPLSDREAAFEIDTDSGKVHFPETGKIKLTNGDFAMLPFNWDLGNGIKLVSATAQPSGKIVHGDEYAMICSTLRDQGGEFVFELPAGATLTTTGQQERRGNRTVVKIKPAMDALITIATPKRRVVCAVLPQARIYRSVEDTINGQKTYLIANQDLVVDKTSDGRAAVRLTGKGVNHFELFSYPPVRWQGQQSGERVGIFGKVAVSVPEVKPEVQVEKAGTKKILIRIPKAAFAGLNDIYAKASFEGLVCRIFDQDTGLPVGDQLWAEGLDWNVGLKRFQKCLAGEGLLFFANPVDEESQKELSADGMTLEQQRVIKKDSRMLDIKFTPEYRAVLEAEPN